MGARIRRTNGSRRGNARILEISDAGGFDQSRRSSHPRGNKNGAGFFFGAGSFKRAFSVVSLESWFPGRLGRQFGERTGIGERMRGAPESPTNRAHSPRRTLRVKTSLWRGKSRACVFHCYSGKFVPRKVVATIRGTRGGQIGKGRTPGISDAHVKVGGGGGSTNSIFLLRGSLGGSTSRTLVWMSWRITQQPLRSASKRACPALDYASTGASSRRWPRPFTATTSKATCACAVPRYART